MRTLGLHLGIRLWPQRYLLRTAVGRRAGLQTQVCGFRASPRALPGPLCACQHQGCSEEAV